MKKNNSGVIGGLIVLFLFCSFLYIGVSSAIKEIRRIDERTKFYDEIHEKCLSAFLDDFPEYNLEDYSISVYTEKSRYIDNGDCQVFACKLKGGWQRENTYQPDTCDDRKQVAEFYLKQK